MNRILTFVLVAGLCAAGQAAPLNRRLDSIKELVAFFGVTPWYGRSQIWAGLLPYFQVGRKMLVDHKDVEHFIQSHKLTN